MENVTARETVERLRLELSCLGISLRQLEARLDRLFRHKLAKGKEDQLSHFRPAGVPRSRRDRTTGILLAALRDWQSFVVRAASTAEKANWPKGKQKILAELENMAAAGSLGFEEFRGELLRIETLRENDPRHSQSEAWKLLTHKRQPGAVVGLLAVIALGSTRAKAYELLKLASDILGPGIASAAGAKLATAVGRFYTKMGFPRDAITVLRTQALPIVVLFGTKEEQAQAYYNIAQAAAMVGLDSIQVAALRRAADSGVETIGFAAKQLLAFQELNTGDVRLASQMYDELIALPFFRKQGGVPVLASLGQGSLHIATRGTLDRPTWRHSNPRSKKRRLFWKSRTKSRLPSTWSSASNLSTKWRKRGSISNRCSWQP